MHFHFQLKDSPSQGLLITRFKKLFSGLCKHSRRLFLNEGFDFMTLVD